QDLLGNNAPNLQLLLANAGLLTEALRPPSQTVMQRQLVVALQNKLAEAELRKNLSAVAEELRGYRTKTGASDYIARVVKEYHLKQGTTPGPMTRDAMVAALKKKQDLGIASLREVFARRMASEKPEPFVEQLFQNNQAPGVYAVQAIIGPEPRREEFL